MLSLYADSLGRPLLQLWAEFCPWPQQGPHFLSHWLWQFRLEAHYEHIICIGLTPTGFWFMGKYLSGGKNPKIVVYVPMILRHVPDLKLSSIYKRRNFSNERREVGRQRKKSG